MAKAAIHHKAVVLLLLIYCLRHFLLFVVVLRLFCYALLCVNSNFSIILKRKRKLALLLLTYRCIVLFCKCSVALSQGAMGRFAVCDCVFPDHTHFFIF